MTSVMHTVVSSYTPTIRALEHARAQAAGLASAQAKAGLPGEALVVSVPEARGYPPLGGVPAEIAALEAHFPSVRRLSGPDATRDRVLAALPGAPLVHFACHADSDLAAAFAGRLILSDGPLSVTDISELRLGGGHLAFLSACTTALGSAGLPDEAVHLTSAFQLAGYAHVVGTLWHASDAASAELAALFYERLEAGRPVSAALHDAVATLCSRAPRTPTTWAPYVHVGP
jgi:CHAT domain-containing protein